MENYTIHPKGLANKPEPHTDYLPISAKEACEKTETYVKVKNEEQLKEIFNKIRAQIVLGKYEITIYKQLSKSNKDFLKSQGFEIHDGPSYCCTSNYKTHNEVFTTISWRNG